MPKNVRLEDLESHIRIKHRIEFPLIQYEDDRKDLYVIDNEYSFEKALKIADERSREQRLSQCMFKVYIDEKKGYIYKCKNWRHDFISESKYGNDQCDKWEESRRYGQSRSKSPTVNRSYTQYNTQYSTPAPNSRYTNSTQFTRADARRANTPMSRSRF
jgi:hypothetical protein